MTCAEFQSRLSAYNDGELSRWTRWKVQQHLGHCPECAALQRDLDEVDAALLGCFAEPAPAYLTEAVMHRLPAMPPPWRRPAVVARWATAGALAGVQLMAVYGAYWWGFARGSSGPEVSSPRRNVTASVGASLRAPAPEQPWRDTEVGHSEVPFRSVSLWGRREGTEPLTPIGISAPATPRFPMTPVLQPGGAH